MCPGQGAGRQTPGRRAGRARRGRVPLSPADGRTRRWRPVGQVDVAATLSTRRRGAYDPAHRSGPDGSVWITCRTAEGPATLRVRGCDDEIEATGWGAGAPWLLDVAPAWLGADDRPEEFRPAHPLLEREVRRQRGLRIGRTGLVMDALVPAILEQKVTGVEAFRSWRRLLARHGDPAPGPAPDGMRVVPGSERLRMIPSWEWHAAGVGPERSRAIVRAAQAAAGLERLAAATSDRAMAGLQSLPGIGPWTAAEVVQRSHGDPDAVSVGDHNLPAAVAYALAGERTADDARMLELLEPYPGQRHRAALLIARSGIRPPRRAPRAPVRDFRRI